MKRRGCALLPLLQLVALLHISIADVRITVPTGRALSVSEGDDAVFVCLYEAGDDVQWTHKGTPVESLDDRRYVVTNSTHSAEEAAELTTTLTIGTATDADDGNVICRNKEDVIFDIAEVSLIVIKNNEAKAILAVDPPNHTIRVESGKELHLNCTGSPDSEPSWTFDGTTLENTLTTTLTAVRRVTHPAAQQLMLTRHAVDDSVEGVYQCVDIADKMRESRAVNVKIISAADTDSSSEADEGSKGSRLDQSLATLLVTCFVASLQ